ncbi:MAG: sugar kinase [Chitinophagia bacterium]|nr:sugar kinase [Chitinophagia bacterium]
MSLMIVGTMAFDAIETPFGKVDKIIGGSATYAAWAASHFVSPIKQVSIIGGDFPAEEIELLKAKDVWFDGVEQLPNDKSFFWSGKYHLDMNNRDTLITDLNVLAKFNPKVPENYQDCDYVMLANLMPSLQFSVIKQLRERPAFLIMDTMNFWMETAMEGLLEVLPHVDLLLVNESEARQLSGEVSLVRAAEKIRAMGPRYIIIKKGEHGALLFYENQLFAAPALPIADVIDPTGAGDSFGGGFIGYLARTGDLSYSNMKAAVVIGSAMASFCVEQFGPQALKTIQPLDIADRVSQFLELMSVDIEVSLFI